MSDRNSAEEEQPERHMDTNGDEDATAPATNDSNAENQTKEDETSDDSDLDDSENDEMDQDVTLQITAYLNHHPPLHPRR